MQVGLAALGIGPGDEVITTPMTFCSTVHVIEHLGARPVLVDVDPVTLTIDPDCVEAAITPRYSAEGSWYYEVVLPGFKCNMTDIQAALGLQQLKKLPAFQQRRRAIVRRYHAAFGALPEVQTPVELPGMASAWHLYVLRLNLERLTIDRARFIEELKQRNIGTSVHFIPVHVHPYYANQYGYHPTDFPIAYREYQRIVTLPLYPRMSDQDVTDVIEAVQDVVAKVRR